MEKASDPQGGVGNFAIGNTEMIELRLPGGASPVRAIAYVLPEAMVHANTSSHAATHNARVAFCASRGGFDYAANLTANAAMNTSLPFVLAAFDEDVPHRCYGLYLFNPKGGRLLAGKVDPFIPRVGAPVMLVTQDRSMAFAIHGNGKLVERAVPHASRTDEGITRAWEELVRRMRVAVSKDSKPMDWDIQLDFPFIDEPTDS